MGKFNAGDKVMCLKDIVFSDGTKHCAYSFYLVDDISFFYYNHPSNKDNYELAK